MLKRNLDATVLYKQYLSRLRAAQIEGFEGPKKLERTLIQKREELGLEPVVFQTVYKNDLDQRMKEEENLFN